MSSIPPQLTLLSSPKQAITYRGRVVDRELVRRAEAVLDDFNRQAGTRHRAYKAGGGTTDSLTRILGAIVAFPDVTGAEWHGAIERAFDDPWWSGHAAVGVVFGPRVVERFLFPPARAIESVDAREKRERGERRARQRLSLRRLREGFDGDHLSAS